MKALLPLSVTLTMAVAAPTHSQNQDRPTPSGPPAVVGEQFGPGETTATSAQPLETLAEGETIETPPEPVRDLYDPDVSNESHNIDPGVATPIKPAPYPYQTGRHANPGEARLLPGHEADERLGPRLGPPRTPTGRSIFEGEGAGATSSGDVLTEPSGVEILEMDEEDR